MSFIAKPQFRAAPVYQPMLREIGLDSQAVFRHPRIKVWRKLSDRENCTLDAKLSDGRAIRLHIKRYEPVRGPLPADEESRGIRSLEQASIPTVPLVGWGHVADGSSFLITEDLAGFEPADKLVEKGLPFDRILEPVADVAAKLHDAGLHHRDLYLCHFFIRHDGNATDVRLIDAARVKPLPGACLKRRWIVKDLAQLWYSTTKLPVTDTQRDTLLARYAQQRKLDDIFRLKTSIQSKSARIARHDANLNEKQPARNVSIPAQ